MRHPRLAASRCRAPAAVFLGLFLAYPVATVLGESFSRGSGWDVLTRDTYFLERAWFTTWQAALSTVITLVLAMPVAWVIACHEFPGKGLFVAVITVPFVLPAIVVAVAFSALLGPEGVVNDALRQLAGADEPPIDVINTIWAILIAHVFYNVALAARIIGGAWGNQDAKLTDAAEMLGAGRVRTFFGVTLPLLRTPILAAASLVFLFCFTSFGVVLILGGPAYSTIETEIYRETLFLFRLPVAATLGLVQLAATFGMMWVNTALQRAAPQQGAGRRRQPPWRPGRVVAVVGVTGVTILLTVLPLAALVERSFHGDGGYTLEYYQRLDDNVRGQALFVAPIEAVRNSLAFATAATVFAVVLGTLAAHGAVRARSPLVEALLQAPLGVSAVTLGLGFVMTFDEAPLNLRASPALVVVAHCLVAMPFVTRVVAAELRAQDPHLREAGAALGANPLRVFWEVDLPLTWRAMAAGAVFAFAISMGEFGATLLIARPDYPTVPVAIFRYLGQPGALNYGQAMAMATILMAVTAAGFVLIDRVRPRGASVL